jgi:hypothetical protein
MDRSQTLIVAVAFASTVLFGGRAARAFDATGTWTGAYSCAEFNGVKSKAGNKASTIEITQTGTVLAMTLNGSFHYNGAVIPDVKKPELQGELVFIQCGTDNVPLAGAQGEIGRATVKTKANTPKASFKALSIFEDPTILDGTCKYSFKRTDTTDPSVTACP